MKETFHKHLPKYIMLVFCSRLDESKSSPTCRCCRLHICYCTHRAVLTWCLLTREQLLWWSLISLTNAICGNLLLSLYMPVVYRRLLNIAHTLYSMQESASIKYIRLTTKFVAVYNALGYSIFDTLMSVLELLNNLAILILKAFWDV